MLSFLYINSKLAIPNEIYDVEFPKQTQTLDLVVVDKISDICFFVIFSQQIEIAGYCSC